MVFVLGDDDQRAPPRKPLGPEMAAEDDKRFAKRPDGKDSEVRSP
jgi:hypothetical protein